MHVVIYRDPSEIEARADEWDDLALSCAAPSIYSSSDYLLAGWRYLVSGRELCVPALLDDDGHLVGAIALRLRYDGVRDGIRLERACRREFDRFGILARAGDEEAVWQELLPAIFELPWTTWYLDWVVERSPVVELLRGWAANQNLTIDVAPDADGYVVDVDGTWEAFLADHKSFRRRLKRFERDVPDAVVDYYERPDTVLRGLDEYLRVDELSWKHGEVGISRSEDSEDFYRSVVPVLAAKKRTAVRILRSGDSLIGGDITHRFGNTAFLHCAVYSREWKSYSPGTVFTGYVLRDLMESDVSRADFLTGYADYIGAWVSETISTETITVARSNAKARSREMASSILRATRTRLG